MGGGVKWEEKPPGAAEDWCYNFGNKGAYDLKAPKKSPIALRMVVLAMTMLCGVFICSMCMKQLGNESWSTVVKIEVSAQPCNKSAVPASEVRFVHYPQPTTYSRVECMCNPVRSLQLSRHSDLEVAGLKPFLIAKLMSAPMVKFSLIKKG